MSSITDYIKKRRILAYYILTFSISWGSILLVMLRSGIPATKEELGTVMPVAIPALLGGPSVAGILMTAIVHGRAGFRDLLARLLNWRVGMRWYAAALSIGPLVLMAELLALSLYSPEFLPAVFSSDGTPRFVLGVAAGLAAGFFEELGWTGFATPELRRRYGVFSTGLIVGVLWGAWHILVNVVLASGAYAGGLSPAFFITARGFGDLVGVLPAFRVLMVWVYDRTGSLLVAMLMHVGLTMATIIFEPPALAGMSLVIYDIASAAIMWAVVGVFAAAQGGRLSQAQEESGSLQ